MAGSLLGSKLVRLLGLRTPPIAIAFRAQPPDDETAQIPRIDRPQPASCGYWRLAAEGRTFYTDATDHFGCAIGAHTHGVAAPAEVQKQLGDLLGMMSGLGYLRMEEVPSIPA